MRISIRQKLALLVGVPVLGATLLALQLFGVTREQARRAEALGSMESLVDLSGRTTALVHELQAERASFALVTGFDKRAVESPLREPRGERQALDEACRGTDAAIGALNAFLANRDEARLPRKLASALGDARRRLRELEAFRVRARGGAELADVLSYYEVVVHPLVQVVAGLTELSDDGELLRILNSLVALLEFEERASREHALLSSVFAQNEFPPGSYRQLVTVISEQDLYGEVFRTSGSVEAQRMLDRALAAEESPRIRELRRRALETTEDELAVEAGDWDRLERRLLGRIASVESHLHDESRRVALAKLRRSENAVRFAMGLAATVVLFSLGFAGVLARGLTRRVERMRDVAQRVGTGDLDVRVQVVSEDELGHLGSAFNHMIEEIGNARAALSNQVRMARELELATAIQRAMLPVSPSHPDFEFSGKMLPADEVGGDFYDVLSDGSALWITIGDVSGHGIGAGLVMLMTQAAFASHFLRDTSADPRRVWQDVNSLLCENIAHRLQDDKYVTAQLLSYRGGGRFACAGAHEWPLVFRAATGRCETIVTPGPWLGIHEQTADVDLTEIQLDPGDVLCLYSDGITEARDGGDALFDVDRLARTLERALQSGNPLSDVTHQVFDAASKFSPRPDDDWTLLLCRRAQ